MNEVIVVAICTFHCDR